MKFFQSFIVAALVICCLGSCTKTIKGSGNFITQQRNVGEFSRIETNGSFDVFITKGNTSSVSINGEDNILEELATEVRDGKLKVHFKRGVNVRHGNITINLVMKELRGLSLTGSGEIRPQGPWKVEDLDCTVTGSGEIVGDFEAENINLTLGGSGTITLTGKAMRSDYALTGSGQIRAYGLVSRNAKVSLTGSGVCELSVDRKLEANISGSGRIRYKGEPAELVKNITGSGKLEKQ